MSFGFNIQNLETVLQSDCTPENWGYLFQNCTKWNDCDRRTIRPYVECRLSNDIAVGLYNDWNPGDILILGDSLTDFATAFNYNPVLPRAFNAGIAGSRISDVVFALYSIEAYFSTVLFRPFSPSKLVVRVGTNDLMRDVNRNFNQFTSATRGQYETIMPPYPSYGLFPKLAAFQTLNQDCEFIICSIPPGTPPGSVCCIDGNEAVQCQSHSVACPDGEISDPCIMYDHDAGNYRQAVIDANTWLAAKCSQYGFTFYEDHDSFLLNPFESPNGPINENLYIGPPTPPSGVPPLYQDLLHFNCDGYKVALSALAQRLYSPLPAASSGAISALPSEPSGQPKSQLNPKTDIFRYLSYVMPPGKSITFKTQGSNVSYAAIFDPNQPYGYPVVQSSTIGYTVAEVSLLNTLSEPKAIILCAGTNSGFNGTYQYTVS